MLWRFKVFTQALKQLKTKLLLFRKCFVKGFIYKYKYKYIYSALNIYNNVYSLHNIQVGTLHSFICDLFVARNGSWMSYKTSKRTEHIFTTMEAESEDWDPVKLA